MPAKTVVRTPSQSPAIQQAASLFPQWDTQYPNGNYDLTPRAANQTVNSIANLPTFMRLPQFEIPFRVSSANQQKYVSIELIYTMDRGQTWFSYESVTPDKEKFDFNAPEDGEYWFAFRAVDKAGEIRQVGPLPAGRVIVDTQPPQLTFEARRNESGEVNIEWSAKDVALKNVLPEISLSYDSNITWERLAVNPKNIIRNAGQETGRVTFWPRHSADAVEIRCELEDAAGNKEIQTTRLVLKAGSGTTAGEHSANNLTDDSANTSETDGPNVPPVTDISVPPPRPVVSHRPIVPETIPTQSVGTVEPVQNFAQDTEKTTTATSLMAASPTTQESQLLALLQNMGGTPPAAVSADVTGRYAGRHVADGAPSNAAVDTQSNASESVSANTAANMPGMLSDIPAPQFVPGNTQGSISGGTNATAAPPVEAQKDAREETFPGKISLVSLGKYGEQDCIIVRWLPGDETLADSKIDLYRSSTRHGPWRAIAFDLKNNGQHYWLVSAEDKMPFYLRVDLRSRQGLFTDFTTHTIATPLSFDLPTQPTASETTPPNDASNETPETSSSPAENTVPSESTSFNQTQPATLAPMSVGLRMPNRLW